MYILIFLTTGRIYDRPITKSCVLNILNLSNLFLTLNYKFTNPHIQFDLSYSQVTNIFGSGKWLNATDYLTR